MILIFDKYVQDLFREAAHSDCALFTHFQSECYLLTACPAPAPCHGCMSGWPDATAPKHDHYHDDHHDHGAVHHAALQHQPG